MYADVLGQSSSKTFQPSGTAEILPGHEPSPSKRRDSRQPRPAPLRRSSGKASPRNGVSRTSSSPAAPADVAVARLLLLDGQQPLQLAGPEGVLLVWGYGLDDAGDLPRFDGRADGKKRCSGVGVRLVLWSRLAGAVCLGVVHTPTGRAMEE